MQRFTAMIVAMVLPVMALAQAPEAVPVQFAGHAGTAADPLPAMGLTLDDFRWTHRPLVVFADNPHDPNYIRQMELLRQQPQMLLDREVVVITDTDAAVLSDIRHRLRPRGFSIIVLDKSGSVLMTRPLPRSVREIAAAIDKTPQRREEIRERRGSLSQ